jgi:hypothetical protein
MPRSARGGKRVTRMSVYTSAALRDPTTIRPDFSLWHFASADAFRLRRTVGRRSIRSTSAVGRGARGDKTEDHRRLPRAACARRLREAADHPVAQYKIEQTYEEVARPAEIDAAISRLADGGAQALVVIASPILISERHRILRLAAARRWPVIGWSREWPADGALMSYGVNTSDSLRRAAYYIDKILKDANPGDLPVEQPTKIELVINLKTAKALGLDVPSLAKLFAAARRRGDRIAMQFAAVHESLVGTKLPVSKGAHARQPSRVPRTCRSRNVSFSQPSAHDPERTPKWRTHCCKDLPPRVTIDGVTWLMLASCRSAEGETCHG